MSITRDKIQEALIEYWGLNESCDSEDERIECMHELINDSHDIVGDIVEALKAI